MRHLELCSPLQSQDTVIKLEKLPKQWMNIEHLAQTDRAGVIDFQVLLDHSETVMAPYELLLETGALGHHAEPPGGRQGRGVCGRGETVTRNHGD